MTAQTLSDPEVRSVLNKPVSNSVETGVQRTPDLVEIDPSKQFLPVGKSSKGTFWTLHSNAFPFDSMSKETKKAKRSLYGIPPQEIASNRLRKTKTLPVQVELLAVRKHIHTLREIVILASRRIEVGDPIGKDLRSLHAAKHRAPSGKGFSTMSDYLIRRYASHCVRVLIQAQRASRSWIPPEYQEEMARSYKVRSGNGKAFCNSGKDHKGYPRGPQGDFVPTQRGLQSRFRHSVSRP